MLALEKNCKRSWTQKAGLFWARIQYRHSRFWCIDVFLSALTQWLQTSSLISVLLSETAATVLVSSENTGAPPYFCNRIGRDFALKLVSVFAKPNCFDRL